MVFGVAWCLLCLLFHHARLMPPTSAPITSAASLVGAVGLEDLPVGRIVAEEHHLNDHDGQGRRERDLHPAVADEHRADDNAGQRQGEQRRAHGVVRVSPLQQALVLDLLQQR